MAGNIGTVTCSWFCVVFQYPFSGGYYWDYYLVVTFIPSGPYLYLSSSRTRAPPLLCFRVVFHYYLVGNIGTTIWRVTLGMRSGGNIGATICTSSLVVFLCRFQDLVLASYIGATIWRVTLGLLSGGGTCLLCTVSVSVVFQDPCLFAFCVLVFVQLLSGG